MWQLHFKGICCPHILCSNIWRHLHPWPKIGQWPYCAITQGGVASMVVVTTQVVVAMTTALLRCTSLDQLIQMGLGQGVYLLYWKFTTTFSSSSSLSRRNMPPLQLLHDSPHALTPHLLEYLSLKTKQHTHTKCGSWIISIHHKICPLPYLPQNLTTTI